MISKSLSTSRRYAQLDALADPLADFCRALYPLLVAHADDFGRQPGDAFTVQHVVCPTFHQRTEAEIDAALDALAAVNLIVRYPEVPGNSRNEVIAVVDFDDHQIGLSKRTKSKFPAPPPGNSRKFPELPASRARAELNGTKQNRTKEDKYRAPRRAFDPHPRSAAENVAVIARLIADEIAPLHLAPVDVPEEVKRRCARLGIAYNATTIRKAIDTAARHKAQARA